MNCVQTKRYKCRCIMFMVMLVAAAIVAAIIMKIVRGKKGGIRLPRIGNRSPPPAAPPPGGPAANRKLLEDLVFIAWDVLQD